MVTEVQPAVLLEPGLVTEALPAALGEPGLVTPVLHLCSPRWHVGAKEVLVESPTSARYRRLLSFKEALW